MAVSQARRKHCGCPVSRILQTQPQCILLTAGDVRSVQQVEDFQQLSATRKNVVSSRESSSGVLRRARPMPVHVRVRWGRALRGSNALLCCGSCQRHGEAFGGQRGKILSPVGFAQRQVIAVTQTVAFQNKQPP